MNIVTIKNNPRRREIPVIESNIISLILGLDYMLVASLKEIARFIITAILNSGGYH
jgi:hypothetical protein